jgi:hypothetical protein
MGKLIDYLDFLPVVPAELLPTPEWIINKPKIDRSSKGLNNPYFQPKHTDNPELNEWVKKNVVYTLSEGLELDPTFIYVRYQVMNTGFPIHTDKYSRRVAINYLLELGGSNVLTQVYDWNNEVLESQRIDLHRWHYLIAELPHNATPIETPRAAISVILKTQEEVPFFKRIDYKPVT